MARASSGVMRCSSRRALRRYSAVEQSQLGLDAGRLVDAQQGGLRGLVVDAVEAVEAEAARLGVAGLREDFGRGARGARVAARVGRGHVSGGCGARPRCSRRPRRTGVDFATSSQELFVEGESALRVERLARRRRARPTRGACRAPRLRMLAKRKSTRSVLPCSSGTISSRRSRSRRAARPVGAVGRGRRARRTAGARAAPRRRGRSQAG